MQLLRTLDHPVRLLFWSYDEFLLMVAPVFIGMLMDSLLCMFSGLLLRPFYLKLKRRHPHGLFKHKLYWLLPEQGRLAGRKRRHLPPSHYRELLL